jgi:hypothetical protein
MACANFTIMTPIGHTGDLRPVLHRKTSSKLRHFQFGGQSNTCHCYGYAFSHFPANAGLIFLTDELTNDRYLVDTGATLSIIPCSQNANPSGPLLKGADGQPIPSWEFIQKKLFSFKANSSLPVYFKPL